MNRQLMHKIHLWLTIPLGVIFFLLCISGATLVFKNELRDAFGMPHVVGMHAGTEMVATEGHQEHTGHHHKAQQAEGKKEAKHHHSKLGKNETTKKDFFSYTQQFHKSLLLGKPGKYIVTYITLASIFILITGVAEIWPKNKKQWKMRFSIERNKGTRRLWYDLHVSLGFWVILWLLLLTVTGCIIGLHLYSMEGDRWFMHLVLDLHTGRWGGVITKVITLIVSLIGASLPITGYYLYFKKANKEKEQTQE